MASFYGTIEEFNRFLMPRIRNRVQLLARPLKDRPGGACEHCGRTDLTLEAAHVHGRGRKVIVREVLEKYRAGEGFHIGDLDSFEREVVEAHEPIGEAFLFLCRDCHKVYDAEEKTGNRAQATEFAVTPAVMTASCAGEAVSFRPARSKSVGGDIVEEFYDYLVASGYTEYTKSGNPGTVYSYKNAVGKVCGWEGVGWSDLAERIEEVLAEYSPDGIKASYGRQSHNTVINGLRAFARFCATREHRCS